MNSQYQKVSRHCMAHLYTIREQFRTVKRARLHLHIRNESTIIKRPGRLIHPICDISCEN